jgi:hypothetical protein
MMTRFTIIVGLCVLLASCGGRSVASKFFEGPPQNREERIRAYPLEDQYSIFRYGNDVIHPPLLELADPIAERGRDVVPFLMRKLEGDPDPATALRDTLLIFERMQGLKSYDIRSDENLMATLQSKVEAFKSESAHWLLAGMMESIRTNR